MNKRPTRQSAAAQPGFPEQFVLDLGVLLQLDLAFINIDFAGQVDRHPILEALFPGSQMCGIRRLWWKRRILRLERLILNH